MVVYKGKIIGNGYNKGYGKILNGNYSVHAEVDAIYDVIKKYKNHGCERILRECSLYVIQYTDKLRNSMPCNNCCKVIEKYGIRRVYFSTETFNEKMI